MQRGGRLSVLVETDIPQNHPILEFARRYPAVKIHRIPDRIVKTYEFNFMVIDDVGYRFESDRKKCQAFVALYDDGSLIKYDGMIDRLKKIFFDLKGVADPIPT